MTGYYEKKVLLKRLNHRGAERIAIFFEKDSELISICKSMRALYSRTHKCWYLDNKRENMKAIFEAFKRKAWVDGSAFFDKNKTPQHLVKERIDIDLTSYAQQELAHFSSSLKARGMSLSTIISYEHALRMFLSYYKEIAPSEINNDHINSFLSDHLYAQGYSRSYHSQFISAIKHFYRDRFQKKVEVDLLVHPKRDKRLPKIFSKEEVACILRSTPNLKHKTLLSLQYGLGLRVSELINLRLSDIDFNRGTVIIFGKGRKGRRVFLGTGLCTVLDTYLEAYKPSDRLFEGQNGEYSRTSVNNVLKRAARRAGIMRNVNSHMLRHSYATHLLEGGVDLRYIQELLGHRSSKTTEIYTYVSTKSLGKIESPFDGLKL